MQSQFAEQEDFQLFPASSVLLISLRNLTVTISKPAIPSEEDAIFSSQYNLG